jgi:hypothetical protein
LTTFLPHEISIADQLGSAASQSFWLSKDRQDDHPNDQEDDDEDVYYRPTQDVSDSSSRKQVGQSLILRRGQGMDQLDKWQVDSAIATWQAMRSIMPIEAWLAY